MLSKTSKIGKNVVKRFFVQQRGDMSNKIVGILLGLVILGALVVGLWPVFTTQNAAVAALTQTDSGTVSLKAMWVVVSIVAGIIIGVGAITMAMKSMKNR